MRGGGGAFPENVSPSALSRETRRAPVSVCESNLLRLHASTRKCAVPLHRTLSVHADRYRGRRKLFVVTGLSRDVWMGDNREHRTRFRRRAGARRGRGGRGGDSALVVDRVTARDFDLGGGFQHAPVVTPYPLPLPFQVFVNMYARVGAALGRTAGAVATGVLA